MSERSSPVSTRPPSWAEPAPLAFGDARVVVFKVIGGLLLVVGLGIGLFVFSWREEASTTADLETLAAGGGVLAEADASASLWVNAGPIGSTVFVDGDSLGVTPLWLDAVALGSRRVQVVSMDGLVVDTMVEAESGMMAEVDLTDPAPSDAPDASPVEVAVAPPAPSPEAAPPPKPTVRQIQTGNLRVTSSPAGAAVVLDGRPIGTTPLAVDNLAVGRHTIVLSKPGFEGTARRVDVRAGAEFEAEIALRTREAPEPRVATPAVPQVGTVEVLVRPWGTVAVDGDVRQRETDVVYRTQLPAGPHRIQVTHPTLGSAEREIVVGAGSTARIEFDLEGSASSGDGLRP